MSGPDLEWVRACLVGLYESKLPVAVHMAGDEPSQDRWDRLTLGEAARLLQEDFAALRAENDRLRAESAELARKNRVLVEHMAHYPIASIDDFGDLALEWSKAARRLTIFVERRGDASFLCSWGSDAANEMRDGWIDEDNDPRALLDWLRSGDGEKGDGAT